MLSIKFYTVSIPDYKYESALSRSSYLIGSIAFKFVGGIS